MNGSFKKYFCLRLNNITLTAKYLRIPKWKQTIEIVEIDVAHDDNFRDYMSIDEFIWNYD